MVTSAGLTVYWLLLINFSEFKAAGQDDLWHHLTLQAHEDGTLPRLDFTKNNKRGKFTCKISTGEYRTISYVSKLSLRKVNKVEPCNLGYAR